MEAYLEMEENRLLDDMEGLSPHVHDMVVRPPYHQHTKGRWRFVTIVSLILLVLSVSANVSQYLHSSRFADRSPHAGVTGGVVRTFYANTEWSDDNQTNADMLWEGLLPETGMIVVDKDYSIKMDLYKTETFPWDNRKDIYLLEGYHSLHCLVYLYRGLREFEQGLPQSQPMRHHYHCLDALRENAICAADDTLRPAGLGPGTPLTPGRNPQKKCRDWDQLERWAVKNSACFKSFPDDHPNHGTLEEWRNCPNDSPFIPIIEDYFNAPQD